MAKKKDRKNKPATRPAAPITRKVAQPATKAKVSTTKTAPANARPMTFSKESLIWMSGGFGLVILGMLLMTGGEMPSKDVWDPNIIYSFRRITLAPLVIIGGICVTAYAILKK